MLLCAILANIFLVSHILLKNLQNMSRHFSHVTKSRIFKNLDLRKKTNRNFCGIFLKNRFRHLKLYSNSPKLISQELLSYAPFERQHIEVHILERAIFSGFGRWKFTTKEDLNRRKQVFLLILDLSPPRNQKFGHFLWEKVYIRKLCSAKAWGFWFKNWYFPSSSCCS